MTSNLQKLAKSLQNYTDNKSLNSIFSVNTTDELYTNESLQSFLSEGLKCFVKNEKCYYKYINNKWIPDTVYSYGDDPPDDINQIWYPTIEDIVSSPEDKVILESLLRTIETLTSRISSLESRVEYLEKNGISIPTEDEDNIVNAILIDEDTPLLIDENTVLLFN